MTVFGSGKENRVSFSVLPQTCNLGEVIKTLGISQEIRLSARHGTRGPAAHFSGSPFDYKCSSSPKTMRAPTHTHLSQVDCQLGVHKHFISD
jgi:hypothetical protein